MRENEPVLLVFPVCEGEIILEKGEILSEKRQTPCWLGEVALLVHSLGKQRVLSAIAQQVHFPRRSFGRYEIILRAKRYFGRNKVADWRMSVFL